MTGKESGPSGQALRPGAGGLISISLADEVTRLKQIPTWASEDRHAASLVKDGPLNVLLMVLKKGAELSEHRTRGPITVHVLSGSIRFRAGSEQITLSAGSMVALDRDVAHSVMALEETSMLLTTAIA